MRLKYEDKIELYELKKQGYTWKELEKKYNVAQRGLRYIVKLIDTHGKEIIRKTSNNKYSVELKKEMIDKVLLERQSIIQTSLEYGLPSFATLSIWIANFKKNGYNIVENPRGRRTMERKPKKKEELSELEKLKIENEYLRTENAYLKKLRELRLKEKISQKEKQK